MNRPQTKDRTHCLCSSSELGKLGQTKPSVNMATLTIESLEIHERNSGNFEIESQERLVRVDIPDCANSNAPPHTAPILQIFIAV